MINLSTISVRPIALAAALLLSSSVAHVATAQQANASAAAFGLGGNYIARARGAHAVAWNPANLGLTGTPGFSFQLLALSTSVGLSPVDLRDINEYDGQTIPKAVREQWVLDAIDGGGEQGSGTAGLNVLALSLGHFGVQLSNSAYIDANVSPDAVEAVFFGNAGRTGTVRNLSLTGSSLRVGDFTSAAVSYGLGFGRSGTGADAKEMAIGVTAKYVLGHGVAIARDNGSAVGTENVELKFPIAYSDPDEAAGGTGTGLGFDVGFSWKGSWAGRHIDFGATIQNAINTFEWDQSKLLLRSGYAFFDQSKDSSDFVEKPFAQAPQALKDAVTANKIKPTISVGLATPFTDRITLSADFRQQMGNEEAVMIGPKTHLGAGAELRVIPMIPLRVGAAYITDGFLLSAGAGISILGSELGLAAALRNTTGGGQSIGVMLGLIGIR